jgi:hypothetical protein
MAKEVNVIQSLRTETSYLQKTKQFYVQHVKTPVAGSVPIPDGFVHRKRRFTVAGVARMEVTL